MRSPVGQNRQTGMAETRWIAICAYRQPFDLRFKSVDDMRQKRAASQSDQRLVRATHPSALPPREDDAEDPHCLPSNTVAGPA